MRLVLMGGSLRPASLNARLLDYLAQTLEARGHEASPFSGEALRLPLYEDGEAPTAAIQALHAGLLKAHGLVIVSPEYNAGIPGHLKNAVDWLSTMKPSPWAGLPVADQQLDGVGAPTDARTAAAVPRTLDAFLALVARLR